MNRYLAVLAILSGCATTLQGSVFIDRNGDHIRQSNEPGLAGVVVAVDRDAFTTTDSNGNFALDTYTDGEIVWARTPTGYRPGPAWVPASAGTLEIGVAPQPATGPLTFVVAADSHTPVDMTTAWDGGDLGAALAQATADAPRFMTIVGDITQGADPAEYQRVSDALAALGVPFVPVPGNHDWFDGGAGYRGRFGPDNYSFDADNIHFIVWDTNLPPDEQIAFFTADLAHANATTVVALGHASPPDDVADAMASLGVDYVFTGHWHANRRVARHGMVEWGTQTFVMGGIDQSPAGYRIVTFDGDTPTVVHRERLIEPHLELVAPHPGSCAGDTLLAAAAIDARAPTVTARIDCGPDIALAPAGGWTFSAPLALTPGTHAIELRSGDLVRTYAVEACASPGTPAQDHWLQVGGGPTHAGSHDAIAPPLQVSWSTPVGGNVLLGTPVVAGDAVLVTVTDLAAGNAGGLVALDLATGAVRWRHVTPYPATGAPAVFGDTAIVTLGDGELHALALADGSVRWTASVSTGLPSLASSLWAPPAIDDAGTVYAGVQFRFSAFDATTGEERWHHDQSNDYPWLGSRGAPAIGGGLALASFSRADGLEAFDTTTGAVRWRFPATAPNAAPVIAGDAVYLADATGEVSAIDLATGARRWTRTITPGGFDWGYSITATPAFASGTLFVATQWSDLVALDAATGSEKWRYATPRGPLELAHYRSAQAGFAAGPIVAGDTVWIGRPDGKLVALAAADGHELWSTALGAPIVSAPAPAGTGLVVAGYDGVVRALVPAAPTTPHDVTACAAIASEAPPPPSGGCSSGGSGSALVLLVLLLPRRLKRKVHRAADAQLARE